MVELRLKLRQSVLLISTLPTRLEITSGYF